MKYFKMNAKTLKRSVVAFSLLITQLCLSGQSTFGIKAGVNYHLAKSETTLHVSDNSDFQLREVTFENFTQGKSIGLFYEKKFDWLFLQTDILYNSYSANYDVVNLTSRVENRSINTEEYHNIDLSVMGGWSNDFFRVGVGPILHKSIGFSSSLDQYHFFQEKEDINYGFQFLTGINLGPVRVDLIYEDNFDKVGSHLLSRNTESRFKNSMNALKLQIGVGF